MSDPIRRVCSRVSIFWLSVLIATWGCAHGPRGSEKTWTVFVDAKAPKDGDGTAQRPWLSMTTAFDSGATEVVVAPGTYEGPWRVVHPVGIRGSAPGVVLTSAVDVPVLWTMGNVGLDSVEVQGGEVGLEGRQGHWRVRNVTWSKQKGAAIRAYNAKVEVRDSQFIATRAGVRGIEAFSNTDLLVESTRFEGPFGRAIALEGSRGKLQQLTAQGTKTAVHATSSQVTGEGWTLEGTGGPGIFCSATQLLLKNVQVLGHEYALLCSGASSVDVAQFQSSRALRAGIGMVKSSFKAQDITVRGSGTLAAIQLTATQAHLQQVAVRETRGFGLQVREGTVDLTGAVFSDIGESTQDDGDAIHVRAGVLNVSNVVITQAAGAGLFASEQANVTAQDLAVTSAHTGAIVAEGQSQLKLNTLKVEKCFVPAVNAFDAAKVQGVGVDARKSPGGLLSADCSQGVQLRLQRSWDFRSKSPADKNGCSPSRSP